MAEKVRKLKGLEREPGYQYFLDKDGDISRIPIQQVKRQVQLPKRKL
jgi:hypothetical protein